MIGKKINREMVEVKPTTIVQIKDQLFVVLSQPDTSNHILIEVGDAEATNIFFSIHSNSFTKVSEDSHDLYVSSLTAFNIHISGVVLSNYDSEEFLWESLIELVNIVDNTSTYLVARPSDIICISLKMNIPILIYQELFDKYKTVLSDEKLKLTKQKTLPKNKNLNALKKQLKECIETEEYEQAAIIQKKITEMEKEN